MPYYHKLMLIFTVCLFLAASQTLGQNIAQSYYSRVELSDIASEDSAIVNYLHQQIEDLKDPVTDIMLMNKKRSLAGTHYTYQQLYKGIPIYNTQIKVNVHNHTITSIFQYTYPTGSWQIDNAAVKALQQVSRQAITKKITQQYQNIHALKYEPVIYYVEETSMPHPAFRIEFFQPNGVRHHEIILDTTQKVLAERDLTCYYQSAPADSDAVTKVFYPDPLTSSGQFYGDSYSDNSDNDNLALNNERKEVTITTQFSDDTFRLENAYAKVWDIESPNVAPAYSTNDTFFFTRSEAGFEDVNAFYHISAYKKYIENKLGFPNLPDFQIRLDTHGDQGQDNSYFSKSPVPNLVFGEGGVDDAEDADVIIHEYGHAISHAAAPNTLNGFERKALDEGLGDYLAASYSKKISTTMWDSVFTWDGWNNFWGGRTASSEKHYPDDLTNTSPHADGEIWSSVLMEIWKTLGPDTTDQLMLQSLYNWSGNMSMTDAALLYLQADTLLYSAQHADIIYDRMVARGLLQDTSESDSTHPKTDTSFNQLISVRNTGGFATKTQPLTIQLPDTTDRAFLTVYNIKGQIVDQYGQNTSRTIQYDGKNLDPGIYFILIQTDFQFKRVKVARLKK